jgi:hypothetical protein
MKPRIRIVALITAAAFMGALTARAAEDAPLISFHDLRAGEVIQVRFISNGCFYTTDHRLRFMGGSARIATVAKVEGVRARHPGTLSLPEADIAALDRLLTFYRARQRGACTTADSITIVHFKDGAPIARESFQDETCAADDRKGLKTFWSIIMPFVPKTPFK